MAPTDESVDTTTETYLSGADTTGAPTEAPAPRRRRATKKAAAPEVQDAPSADGEEPTAGTPPRRTRSRKAAAAAATAETGAETETDAALPDESGEPWAEQVEKPARKAARKSTTKKSTKKAGRKPSDAPTEQAEQAEQAEPADSELVSDPVTEPESEPESGDEAPARSGAGLGLLFRAPDLSEAQPRRRATRPASTPVVPSETTSADADEAPEEVVEAEEAEESDEAGTEGTDGSAATSEEQESGDGASRRNRRRRGGRGRRGRARDGEPEPEDARSVGEAEASGEAAETEDHPDSDGDGDEQAAGRRRRRRRRAGAPGDQDDPPGTVTRVRQPRARDEVTGVKGSTRLEAKKQRRREGREAGRRRTIITEAEFLARRESVDRVMLVRGREDRTQIAVLEDDVLVEHYVSRETTASMAGNVYLGRVQNVLPSMEAAFVDIGKGRNAVLYAGEVNWDAAGLEGNAPKRIENALRSGDTVLVQVTKDPIGHKGARLTSQISLPGRYLVYVPEGSMTGISRKLPDTERARLKAILKEVVPDKAGVIVRTAAEGASEEELRADVERLTTMWDRISDKADKAKAKKSGAGGAPVLLHGEPDLTVRVIRDIFNEDFSKLVVAGDKAAGEVSDYIGDVAPDLADRIETWTGERDVFAAHRVDEQIAKAMDRKVWLPSGGSLVIDRTEAMTVVDVNTGKFVGSGGNLEETVTKNNIEAAEEIVRQLRLRDIGGIIVIDFIDMVLESNRDLVVRRLLECLGRDRTKHQVAEVTSLGLVQMTRKRVGSGLIEVFGETCEHCGGRGITIHSEPIERGPDSGAGSNGGQGHGGAGQGGGRGSRRGGRGGSSGGHDAPEAPAPERPVHSGPTAAQIAAAAHAAALKAMTSEHPDEAMEATQAVAETEPEATGEPVETGPVHETHDETNAQGSADETVVPILLDEDFASDVQPVQAPDLDEVMAERVHFEAPPEQVVTPTRRKRGRVVAPAGPPSSASATGDPGGGLEGGAV